MNEKELLQSEFIKRFGLFDGTFDGVDKWLTSTSAGERSAYYLKAKEMVNHEVFQREMLEMKRKAYTILALNELSDLERQGYKMLLIALDEMDKRFQVLASRYSQKPLTNVSDGF